MIDSKKWSFDDAHAFFNLPFNDLIFKAHSIHRKQHDPNAIQISTLLNIKTGSCPEDCAYCPQSAHYNTNLKKEPLLAVSEVKLAAQKAKEAGLDYYNHNRYLIRLL